MDYDEVGAQLLVDTKINGEDRKVLAHFGRNGIFYTSTAPTAPTSSRASTSAS